MSKSSYIVKKLIATAFALVVTEAGTAYGSLCPDDHRQTICHGEACCCPKERFNGRMAVCYNADAEFCYGPACCTHPTYGPCEGGSSEPEKPKRNRSRGGW